MSVELLEMAVPAETASATPVARPPRRRRSIVRMVGAGVERLFGFASLVGLSAVVVTVPGLQPLVLGYLLESSRRTAVSGRLRDGLPGLSAAARLGTIAVAFFVAGLPLAYVASLAASARAIEPGGPAERRLSAVLVVLTVAIGLHLVGVLIRGGRFRHFLWPRPIVTWQLLTARGTYAATRDAVYDFVVRLRLPYLYGLGLRAALATAAWLVVPVTIMVLGRERPILAVVGGLLTAAAVAPLPWLQTQFAVAGRLRAMFAVGDVRRRFRRAPLMHALTLLFVLALAVPLYLLKIELLPSEAAWLPSLVFVLFAVPGRLALGRVYAYAERRTVPRGRLLTWSGRAIVVAAASAYVLITFLSQTTSWFGRWSLYEQHAFLFPVPFGQWR